jgi:hypothetical protein
MLPKNITRFIYLPNVVVRSATTAWRGTITEIGYRESADFGDVPSWLEIELPVDTYVGRFAPERVLVNFSHVESIAAETTLQEQVRQRTAYYAAHPLSEED